MIATDVAVERETTTVGRPRRPCADFPELGYPVRIPAIRGDDPDLADREARAPIVVGNQPSARRPRRVGSVPGRAQEPARAAALCGNDEQRTLTRERNRPSVRRPGRMIVVQPCVRDAPQPGAVSPHDVDMRSAAAPARERDHSAVRRPGRLDLEEQAGRRRRITLLLRQPLLVTALDVDAEEPVVAVASRDEDDVRGPVRRRRAAPAGDHEQRQKREQRSHRWTHAGANARPARRRGNAAGARGCRRARRRSSRLRSHRRP
jgi:hypothetical protein